MKQFKKKYIPYIVCGLVAIVFCYVSVWLCRDPLGKAINIAAIAIMGALVIWGYGKIGTTEDKKYSGLSALQNAAEDLKRVSEQIAELAKNPEADIKNKACREDVFHEPALAEAYKDFLSESARLNHSQREYYYCDIADYINEDLMDEIANRSFNDLIGSAMTGIGILGTFIGLCIGLQNFDSGNSEEMMNTISSLIDGIKIAFLTSIFGMVSSLIFNFVYHRQLRSASEAVSTFVQVFYEKVSARPDNEGITQLVQYEAQQTKSMEQFAEDISLALTKQISEAFMPTLQQIDSSMRMQSEQLPQSVSSAIADNVVPALSEIEQNIGNLTSKVVEIQDQNMARIAEDFVAHMDEAMGSQLNRLGESIKALCEWQEGTIQGMQSTTENICAMANKLSDMNQSLQNSANAFESYMKQLDAAQSNISEQYQQLFADMKELSSNMVAQSETMSKLLESEAESIANMAELDKTSSERLDELKNLFDHQKNALDKNLQMQEDSLKTFVEKLTTISEQQTAKMNEVLNTQQQQLVENLKAQAKSVQEYTAQIETMKSDISTALKESASAMGRSSDAMAEASKNLTNNLDGAMERTYRQIDKQLADVVTHLSGTISEIQDVSEKVPQVIEMSAEQLHKQTNEYLRTVAASQDQLTKTVSTLVRNSEHTKSN